MQLQVPTMGFPESFCCNCGDPNCMNELQDTRVTRYFGLGGSESTFKLPVPVCAVCRRSTRRRPSGFFAKLLVLAICICVFFLGLLALGSYVVLPLWMSDHLFWHSVALAVLAWIIVYRLRRPRPPQTSFYQPVRIKAVDMRVVDVSAGHGQVAFMKLAFTNEAYLQEFANANSAAIAAGYLAVVKA